MSEEIIELEICDSCYGKLERILDSHRMLKEEKERLARVMEAALAALKHDDSEPWGPAIAPVSWAIAHMEYVLKQGSEKEK